MQVNVWKDEVLSVILSAKSSKNENNLFGLMDFINVLFYIRGMSEKQLIQQLKTLPAEARQEAADFIDYLHKKYFHKEEKHNSKNSILESAFRGIWKNREDMQDSTEWIRNIRKSRFAN